MPCSCFGKTKKKSNEHVAAEEYPMVVGLGPSFDNGPEHRVGYICQDGNTLVEYRPDNSRQSSSYVDSPTSNSNTHTPSTIPVMASSNASQKSSVPSSPTLSRSGATSRADLAEMRREFFKDFLHEEERPRYNNNNSPSTLPTVARARHFGKVRTMRPVSQPSSHSDPVFVETSPPGPHLLRPCLKPSRSPTEIENDADRQVGGFASSEFLRELKSASSEISKRWAMSEDELESFPVGLKIKKIDVMELELAATSEEKLVQQSVENINNNNNKNNNNNIDISHSLFANVTNETVVSPSADVTQGSIEYSSSFHEVPKEMYTDSSLTEQSIPDPNFEANITQPNISHFDLHYNEQEEKNDFETNIDYLVKASTFKEDSFDLSDELELERNILRKQSSSDLKDDVNLLTDSKESLELDVSSTEVKLSSGFLCSDAQLDLPPEEPILLSSSDSKLYSESVDLETQKDPVFTLNNEFESSDNEFESSDLLDLKIQHEFPRIETNDSPIHGVLKTPDSTNLQTPP